jgi:hypothetical protein
VRRASTANAAVNGVIGSQAGKTRPIMWLASGSAIARTSRDSNSSIDD